MIERVYRECTGSERVKVSSSIMAKALHRREGRGLDVKPQGSPRLRPKHLYQTTRDHCYSQAAIHLLLMGASPINGNEAPLWLIIVPLL